MKIKGVLKHTPFFIIPLFLFVLTTSAFALGKPYDVGFRATSQGYAKQNNQVSKEDGKLRSCQAREAAIKTRLSHLISLVTNMENKFDAHATRVENYYTLKVVPSGKTVTNYNSLVTDIQTKKTAVQTALNNAKNDVNSFNCTGNPKDQLTQFRKDMQEVKRALKDYRTAIKNLIVDVHLVTGVENSEPSGSPKPSQESGRRE